MTAPAALDLAELNPEQRTAVTTLEGPLLVLAGAGTGKTRVITARIAHLLREGVSPRRILAMTFTNKAAGEMRGRVASLVGADAARELTVGTFHSFCARNLRRHASTLDIPASYGIADAADQVAAVRGVLRDLLVPDAALHPRVAQARISFLKNRLVTPRQFRSEAADDQDELLGRVYRRYEEHLRRSGLLDFDDLLLFMVRLLAEHEEVRAELGSRYGYVMVDEYQDTNLAQYEIVRWIAKEHRNVCVVGDDDQSIYGWRGADVRKILGFERDFPGAATVRLETNYRSTRQILDAANAVIACNPDRHPKTLRASQGEGDPVVLYQAADEEDEAEYVVRSVLERVSRRRERLGDFTILVRTQAQPRAFEARLRAHRVPYVIVGGMSFFDRKEVRDLIAFLRLAVNPGDEAALLRIINTPPRGIGKISVTRLLEHASREGVSAATAFCDLRQVEGIPPAAASAGAALLRVLGAVGREAAEGRLVDALQRLIRDVSYEDEVRRCYPDAVTREGRWASVTEVVNFAENFARREDAGGLVEFLEELALTADDDKTSEDPRRRNAVTLMTLHAAKGLEYPNVYLVGCEEGILPHQRSIDADDVEEERRLMYVGVTRARERLVITHAAERARYGRRETRVPSRFLFEMLGFMGDDDELPDRLPDHPAYLVARHGEASPVGPPRRAPETRSTGPFSSRPFRGGRAKKKKKKKKKPR